MAERTLHRFFISIVVPTILAIALYIISIFLVILPSFEANILEVKKEMISELTNAAWSLLDEYHQEVRTNQLAEDSARHMAASRVEQIRYGEEYKDYFWIIDKTPVMIMHPYRPELEGRSLIDYKDPEGTLLFVEAVETVDAQGEGFIDYMWQWKDDPTRTVPKLSYVKEFKPWGWIIGTGIYLEDVRQEIRLLKKRLLRIAMLITAITGIILGFVIRQSLLIEKRRKLAENNLRRSREKYKALVDASTEGTLMILNDKIIYSNLKFCNLSGYDPSETRNMLIGELFNAGWTDLTASIGDPKKTVSKEGRLHCKDGSWKEVVISLSRVSYGEQSGYIMVLKEVSAQHQFKKNFGILTSEMQISLALSHQPLKPIAKELKKCPSTSSIREVAAILARKQQQVLFVSQDDRIIGVVTHSDLTHRVIADSVDTGMPVVQIMSSPVVSIRDDAPVYQALLMMKKHGISHLAVGDSADQLHGVISISDIIDIQPNAITHLIYEINAAEGIQQLRDLYSRLTVLVTAFTESGHKAEHITGIISTANDAIHRRIIVLAMEEAGPPPCGFAFLVTGSEGRREQTLATDQDNAIVFQDLPADRSARATTYFLGLGNKINSDLNDIGYNFCKGDMMAMNPRWTQPLSVWKDYFSGWIRNGNPNDVMEASICFDFRPVFGDEELASDLRKHIKEVSENQSAFFFHMAQAIVKYKSPLNVFGNIIGNESGPGEHLLDIKRAIFPVVASLRLYAVREGLSETNSLERADRLNACGVLGDSMYEDLVEAHALMTGLRLRTQVEALGRNAPPGNLVDLHQVTRIEMAVLKKILSEIGELQSKVSFDFKSIG